MKSKTWTGLASVILMAVLGAVGLAVAAAPEPATAPVRLVAVSPVSASAGSALEVRASGPFTFTFYQPDERSLVVDMAGVVLETVASTRELGVNWVAGYRLLPFRNAGGPADRHDRPRR